MENLFTKTAYPIKGYILLPQLLQLRGRQCECCKLTTWLDQPINLQVHHIDGDKTNNCLDNLQLLCLNCHSYTDTFGIRNHNQPTISEEEFVNALQTSTSIRQALLNLNLSDAGGNYKRARQLCQKYNIIFPTKSKENFCKRCGVAISIDGVYCHSCASYLSRVTERPTREQLKEEIRTTPFTQLGSNYGVSDKAIVNWCKAYQLPFRKKDIKNYTDQEWEQV